MAGWCGIVRSIRRRPIGAASNHSQRGIAAVEFAIILPVLVTLCLLTVETARFLLLNMKLSHAATSMADLATREKELTVATLDSLFSSVRYITDPFIFTNDGVVIVSGVSEDNAKAVTVSWQRRGAGSLSANSEIGDVAETAVLPANFSVGANQTVVTAEVFFQYQPWLMGIIPGQLLHHVSYYRPRLGTLKNLARLDGAVVATSIACHGDGGPHHSG